MSYKSRALIITVFFYIFTNYHCVEFLGVKTKSIKCFKLPAEIVHHSQIDLPSLCHRITTDIVTTTKDIDEKLVPINWLPVKHIYLIGIMVRFFTLRYLGSITLSSIIVQMWYFSDRTALFAWENPFGLIRKNVWKNIVAKCDLQILLYYTVLNQ